MYKHVLVALLCAWVANQTRANKLFAIDATYGSGNSVRVENSSLPMSRSSTLSSERRLATYSTKTSSRTIVCVWNIGSWASKSTVVPAGPFAIVDSCCIASIQSLWAKIKISPYRLKCNC